MSNLYKFQEWIESEIESILPEGIEVYSRRKGNIESDIEASLANLGLAVLVFPPMPMQWSNSIVLRADKIDTQIHIIENVTTNSSTENAFTLLEKIAKHIHSSRCEELSSPVITLGAVQDQSPLDEGLNIFVLTISNSLII